jgi:hypothetical protein
MQQSGSQFELAATFHAAMGFGLSDEQVWEAAPRHCRSHAC